MSSTASNVEECFNFESKYRESKGIWTLNFRTADETAWTLEEDWLTAEKKPNDCLQRLIFRKENHYERFYSIDIEITSTYNNSFRMIKEEAKISFERFTKFIIPLHKFTIFRYSYFSFIEKHGVKISEKALTDIFRYKVTISTVNVLKHEISNLRIPCRDTAMVFSDHICSLLESGNFSDAVLKVGQVDIRVHKNILSARSPVFQKMFQSNMRESIGGIVFIKDIPIKCVREMLIYMYSGVLWPVDFETAKDLYNAADKYVLLELKKLCSLQLQRHLSVENSVIALFLASSHNEDDLYEASLELSAKNFDQVKLSAPWPEFENRYPDLVQNIEKRRHEIFKNAQNYEILKNALNH